MNDHDACIILNMLNGIGGLSAWNRYVSPSGALLEAAGGLSGIFGMDVADIVRLGGIAPGIAELIPRWREFADLGRELELAAREKAAIVCRTDGDYPASLRELADPPLCIYVQGTLPAGIGTGNSVAIVGTRTPTDRGVRMARRFAEEAARGGWTTVSGLARGIDTAAHQATLDASGRTVAIPGSGLANVYPPENRELARAITDAGGAVVSEYPMDTGASRSTLPRRNRVIAALSRCTLVVEAGKKSGALRTAKYARARGCRVFAVPGAEDDPLAMGSNELIRQQGAKPVTDFGDMLDGI